MSQGLGITEHTISEGGGNLELKLEIQHFSLSYSRSGENYLFPYITFEILSVA